MSHSPKPSTIIFWLLLTFSYNLLALSLNYHFSGIVILILPFNNNYQILLSQIFSIPFFFYFLFSVWQYSHLNSRLCACYSGVLPLELYLMASMNYNVPICAYTHTPHSALVEMKLCKTYARADLKLWAISASTVGNFTDLNHSTQLWSFLF
jgi:hypothetical protein